MNKILLIFIFSLLLSFCTSSNTTKLTLQQIADKKGATIGVLSKIFRVDTSTQLPDGSYILLNIVSIKKYNEFTGNTGTKLKNVIILENVSPFGDTRIYLENSAYFSVIDEFGNEDSSIESYVQKGKQFTEIILVSNQNLNNYKYLIIGGLDRKMNDGNNKKIFEIK